MQQINLYLPEFRPKQELVSARNCILVILLIIVLIVFNYISSATELHRLETSVMNLSAENKIIKEKLDVLKKTPLGESRQRIEGQIDRVRKAIANRNHVAEVMNGKSLGNENGFSKYMDALSHFSLEGLFLEQFTITEGGRFAQLKGMSKKPELVPLYISRLQKDSVFSETKFGYLSISNKDPYVEFSLSGSEKMNLLK